MLNLYYKEPSLQRSIISICTALILLIPKKALKEKGVSYTL